MKKIILFVIILLSLKTQAQRLNFVIMIDNEIEGLNIADGEFKVQHLASGLNEILPFKYHLGDIELSKIDLDKIFRLKPGDRLIITFKSIRLVPSHSENLFEYKIPVELINPDYMLMKIFTASKKNRKKYVFDRQKYLIEFNTSSSSTILLQK